MDTYINEFVSLLATVIPHVKQLANQDYKLGQTFKGCFDIYFITLWYDATWELYVGWTVSPLAVDLVRYNITYTPYAKLAVGGGVTATSYMFQGDFRANSVIFRSELPVTTQYENNVYQLCYKSDLSFYQPSADISIQASVKECMQDVERSMRTGDYTWTCNFNSPMRITLYNNTGPVTVNNVVPRTCFTLFS